MSRFELAVISPVAGKRGDLKYYRTVDADNVTQAVAIAREEVRGSGLIVLQAPSYNQGQPQNEVIINRLIEAYDRSLAYDL